MLGIVALLPIRRAHFLTLATCLLGVVAMQVLAETSREAELRRIIKSNMHFHMHCMCIAVTNETVPAIRKVVSEADIPALVNLLQDQDTKVVAGASAVLTDFGDAALPALHLSLARGGSHASSVILDIGYLKKRRK